MMSFCAMQILILACRSVHLRAWISMAVWQVRAGWGPTAAGLEREAHMLLLQVSNRYLSVPVALRCACPAPHRPHSHGHYDTRSLLTLFAIVRRARDERRESGDANCCAVQGSCLLACALTPLTQASGTQ